MSEKFYAVLQIEKEHQVELIGMTKTLELSWFKGMIGVIPVFKTREEAEKYAKGKREIMEVETLQ